MTTKRWLPFVLFLLFVIAVIVCKDEGKLAGFFALGANIPAGDKVGHVILIGTLAFLLNMALSWKTVGIGPLRLQLGGLIILVLITGEEISQIWIATRTFDLGDLAANYAGIFFAELLARGLRPRIREGGEDGTTTGTSGA